MQVVTFKFKFLINASKNRNQEGKNNNYRLIIGDKRKKYYAQKVLHNYLIIIHYMYNKFINF